jgi:hypothetical protein
MLHSHLSSIKERDGSTEIKRKRGFYWNEGKRGFYWNADEQPYIFAFEKRTKTNSTHLKEREHLFSSTTPLYFDSSITLIGSAGTVYRNENIKI